MGRKPLSNAMRIAVGRPQKKTSSDAPGLVVPVECPDSPSLSIAAQEEWERITPYLVAGRRLSKLDRQSLATYCQSWALFCQAMLELQSSPLWSNSAGRDRPNVLESIAKQHALIVIENARRFGMTARTRHLDHANAGRPALPNELHVMRGNPSKKKLRGVSPVSVGDENEPPSWLSQEAKFEWNSIVDQLRQIQLWTALDWVPISICCAAYAITCRAFRELASVNLYSETESGAAIEHPLSKIARSQQELLTEIWRDYGMSPLDRYRFKHATDASGKPKLKIYL